MEKEKILGTRDRDSHLPFPGVALSGVALPKDIFSFSNIHQSSHISQ